MRRCAARARSRAPAECRAAHPSRRRGAAVRSGGWPRPRRWVLASLALAAARCAQGAAFLPGTEADPPTGAVQRGEPNAAEPLAGSGIQWRLGPWRHQGQVVLEARGLQLEDGSRTRLLLGSAEVDWANHIWQPWFVQFRLGLGLVGSRSDGSGPATVQGQNVTARAAISVFPASRFPFELRADLGDSRSGNAGGALNLGTEYRSRRLSLSQGWRPEVGNRHLQLQLDRSELIDDRGRDTLSTLNASALHQQGPQQWDLALGWSDNRRSDTAEHTRLASAAARHSWRPDSGLSVETLASVNEVRLGLGSTGGAASRVDQLSSFVAWRPSRRPWAGAGQTLVAGSARWARVDSSGAGASGGSQALSATLGVTQELSEAWRTGLSLSGTQVQADAGNGGSTWATQAGVNWAPPVAALAGWRYAPSAGFNAGLSAVDRADGVGSGGRVRRETAGAQGAHGVSREVSLDDAGLLSLSLTQSAATLHESGQPQATRSLAHGAGLGWQWQPADAQQLFGGLTLSEARNRGADRGRFRLVNLQFSHRWALGRYAYWAANFTFQATRNDSTALDAFSGQRRESTDSGHWQRMTTGALSYEDQRAFGVPRLRHSVQLSLASQPLERRALGDIDAPRERVSQSLESRLDYPIGRLDARLAVRVARVEGRSVAGVQARLQRRF